MMSTGEAEKTRATRALVIFMTEHGASKMRVQPIQEVLDLLENGKLRKARDVFGQIPLGTMGCLDDWFPSVAYPHEDDDYVLAVFGALVREWSVRMSVK